MSSAFRRSLPARPDLDQQKKLAKELLRAYRAATADIESPAAYLTTITTRLAIDHLRSARVRRGGA